MAAKATQMYKDAGMNYATADYTYLVEWYDRLGYAVWRQYRMSWKDV